MMKARTLSRLIAPMAAAAVLGLASPAAALDPEDVYRSAVKDMQDGKYADACPKFAEARRLKPDATPALIGLAQCYDKLGKTASAWSKYRELSVDLKNQGEAAKAETASKRAEELEKLLSTLLIKPQGADTPGLIVRLDREEVAAALLGTAVKVDPGPHVIEATAPGYNVWQTTVTIGAQNDAQTVAVPALVALPTPKNALRPAAFAALGVGGAGLVVGGVLGGLALRAKGALQTDCPGGVCTTAAAQGERSSAAARALGSTVGLSVGGAFVAAGVALLVVSLRAPARRDAAAAPKTSLVPSFGPGGAGLDLVGVF